MKIRCLHGREDSDGNALCVQYNNQGEIIEQCSGWVGIPRVKTTEAGVPLLINNKPVYETYWNCYANQQIQQQFELSALLQQVVSQEQELRGEVARRFDVLTGGVARAIGHTNGRMVDAAPDNNADPELTDERP